MPSMSLQPASPNPTSQVTALYAICAHCGDPVPAAYRSVGNAPAFCCEGCASVYALLKELELDRDYYSLKGSNRSPIKPDTQSAEDYVALDSAPFRNPDVAHPTLEFFIEGIHCTACVWILERLPQLSPEIESARLDMGRSLLRVQVGPEGRFATAAKLLAQLGYRPHPILTSNEAEKCLRAEDRKTLRRLGISAFAAMNVMIYSISLYSGVDGGAAVLFRWLSIIAAVPALTYGAFPFYKNAATALRERRISIDLPISIAFIVGLVESVRQTFLGTNLLYLDSVTSLVFLMLASRYALARLERAEVSKSGILRALIPARCTRVFDGGRRTEKVRVDALVAGDSVILEAGELVPADGRIESGEISIDCSFLTGESRPVPSRKGDSVYAGSRVLDGRAVIRVETRGSETQLGRIQSKLETIVPRKNKRTERSDRWAVIFLTSVLGFAAVLLVLYGATDPAEAIRRSLSLLIIACPCALALATPLTLARAHRLAASRGILLRNSEVLEEVAEVSEVFFDKTGTLTLGRPVVRSWNWSSNLSDSERLELRSAALSIEGKAKHPYGRAIVEYLRDDPKVRRLEVTDLLEVPGLGIRGMIAGVPYEILRSENDSDLSTVRFLRNGVSVAEIHLEDDLRPDAGSALARLKQRGLRLSILSGDANAVVRKIAKEAGIENFEARLSPEEKKVRVEKASERTGTLMVGDGVNDVLALRSATVGVAMSRGEGSSIESILSTSEVALLRPEVQSLDDLFDVARRYRHVLFRNAVFSTAYNLIGASFAAAGFVHPLVAAIAMPTSALTVYLSTLIGLREGKKRSE